MVQHWANTGINKLLLLEGMCPTVAPEQHRLPELLLKCIPVESVGRGEGLPCVDTTCWGVGCPGFMCQVLYFGFFFSLLQALDNIILIT